MEKIAVIAGTIIDTKMGVDQLEKYNIPAVGFPISRTCEEQDSLQYLDENELYCIVDKIILDITSQKIGKVMVYCNSLSGIVDFKKLAIKHSIVIVTPFDAYDEIGVFKGDYMIISANGKSAYNLENYFKKLQKDASYITMGILPVVKMIEENIEARDIIERYGIMDLIKMMEKLPLKREKRIVLGCTHFSHIYGELQKCTNIMILDPTITMIKKLSGE